MAYGWTGQLLRIDLTKGAVTKEPLNMTWAREYIGGRGVGTRYLYEEMDPTVDALSPANTLSNLKEKAPYADETSENNETLRCFHPESLDSFY